MAHAEGAGPIRVTAQACPNKANGFATLKQFALLQSR